MGILDETVVEEGARNNDDLITDSFIDNAANIKSDVTGFEARTRIANYIILPSFLMSM